MRFEISDTGIGISPAAQERIFESFVQADDTIVDRFGGTGLGLALCKQVVETLGGQIGVVSALGAGSTFWFEINLGYRSEQPASQNHSEPVVLIHADAQLTELVRGFASNIRLVEDAEQAIAELKHLENLAERQMVAVFDCCPENGAAEAILDSNLNFVPIFIRAMGSDEQGLVSNPRRSYYTATIRKAPDRAELTSVLRIATAVGGRKVVSKQALPGIQRDKNLSILVADDNRTNLLVLSKVLERAGHAVTVVENGADAVEALRRNSFDVALMDLNMPVLNGIDAFKQYRSSLGDRAPTPVVALTADATTEAADRCAEVGFQACATKPIKPEDLLELISKVVARSLIESESPTLIPEPAHANGNHCGPTGKDTVRRETLRKLEQLGGRHFVEELIEQFTNDGQHMLDCLQLALAETNAVEFGDQLHAMRSAAGNIGAESLYCICLSLRRITREDLAAKGEEHLQRLTAEFERVRQELADYLAGAAAAQDLVSGLA